MTTIRLIGPKVLVRRLATPEQTKTGLLLPDSAQERPQLGHVVAVGGANARDVRVGDLVMFPKYSDSYVEIDGERLLELRYNEIIARIET